MQIGHFISLAVFRGYDAGDPTNYFDGELPNASGKIRWHAWGLITDIISDNTIRMKGADINALVGLADPFDKGDFDNGVGVGTFTSGYRAAWTVYEGVRTLVAPSGRLVSSYDDFAFLPAYKISGAIGTGRVDAPYVAHWEGDRLEPNGNLPLTGVTNKAFWIRLDESFLKVRPSLGAAAPAIAEEASVVLFGDGVMSAQRIQYQTDKYVAYEDVEYPVGATVEGLVQALSTPATEGMTQFDPLSADSWPLAAGFQVNPKGLSGFLLPHPMGLMHTDPGEQFAPDLVAPNNNVDGQVVQLFASREEEVGFASLITVSDIPGSVPFPGQFSPGLVVKDDEIHLGGLTDVYTKFSSEEERTTDQILLTPNDLLDTNLVLASGTDGQIDFSAVNAENFTSPALEAFLADYFDISNTSSLGNLVVQLIEVADAVLPKAFLVINNIANGVRISGTFSGLVGILASDGGSC